jgi:hypothetical protein
MKDEATGIVAARLTPLVGGAAGEWRDDTDTTWGRDRLVLPERAFR